MSLGPTWPIAPANVLEQIVVSKWRPIFERIRRYLGERDRLHRIELPPTTPNKRTRRSRDLTTRTSGEGKLTGEGPVDNHLYRCDIVLHGHFRARHYKITAQPHFRHILHNFEIVGGHIRPGTNTGPLVTGRSRLIHRQTHRLQGPQ